MSAFDNANDTLAIIQTMYDKDFAPYFKENHDLYKRMQSEVRPITDEELSRVLIALPLSLFEVGAAISDLRTKVEIAKLRIKEVEFAIMQESEAKTITAKKDEAMMHTMDDHVLLCAYLGLIDRVEAEMSFSRELIMGAKKIWDSRRRTEDSNPVAPIDIPEYDGGLV